MAIKVANNNSLASITALPSGVSGGAMTLLETQTASSSSTIQFTSGIDDTYKEYQIHFMDVHPSGDGAAFTVNFRDGSTAYDATKTTTYFLASHNENDAATQFEYRTGDDLAQSTSFQPIYNNGLGADNDQSVSGILKLYDPSNTTFVKHFLCEAQGALDGDLSLIVYMAGYCNVTAAIDGVQFKMASGNIDSGIIKLFGVS